MAASEVQRFLATLEHDSALKDKVQVGAAGAVDQVSAVAAVARSEGYDFGDDELKAALAALADASRELSDDELSQVAGGMGQATLLHPGMSISPIHLGMMKDG